MTLRNIFFVGATRSPGSIKPVMIGEGAFIGVNSIILGGITIGTGAIIGAGSIVTHDVPDHAIVAGNPAKRIGTPPDTSVLSDRNWT